MELRPQDLVRRAIGTTPVVDRKQTVATRIGGGFESGREPAEGGGHGSKSASDDWEARI